MQKQKRSGKKQRRDNLTKIKHLAAVFYYFVSLTVMLITLWDRFAK